MKDAPTKLSHYTVPVVLLDMTRNKIQDPAGIQAQHLPNTSDVLTIRPLGPLVEEQRTSYISSIA